MQTGSVSVYITTALSGLLFAVLGGVLLAAPQLVTGSLALRAGWLVALAVAVALSLGAFVMHQQQTRQTAERYVDLLCRLDPLDIAGDAESEALPSLESGSPWCDVFNRVRDCILSYGQKLEEAEHARASAEVRVKRLNDDHDQMKEVLANLSDPILAIDHFDELVLANRSAQSLFSIEQEENGAERRALQRVVDCQALVDLLTETRRHKTAIQRTGEISLQDTSGTTHWYRVTASNLAADDTSDQEEHGAVAVLNDISSEKGIQRRHAEFVAAVSHEMKTPLAGIKAYVELLADGDDEEPETCEEFLDVINSQADRLQRLIENLLNLARIEAGVVEVDKQSRSLNEILEEAVGVVQPAADQKEIELASQLSPMYLGVLVDHDMILQSAINLLSNAIKYTPEAGRVCLRSQMVDGEVVFEVEDTGVGLSPDDCEKVFDKFFRVKKDSQMAAGTGLGLPLARHIVHDVHGGKLTVESEPGRGSTFRVTLPMVGAGQN